MGAIVIKNIKSLLNAFIFILLLIISVNNANSENPPVSEIAADYILVEKSLKRLTLFSHEKPIKSYTVAIGRNPIGPKLEEGDQKTPEGRYIIDTRNQDSDSYLSLHISYPNTIDRELASLAGLTSGGNIVIHGTGDEYAWMGKFHSVLDWTDGCIAVTNEEIQEIWGLVPDGTVIDIRP